MFKNKADTGKNNICGQKILELRKQAVPSMSQRILAEKMQLLGIDLDKNAIQRIECGQRFVTDIEIRGFRAVFNTSYEELLRTDEL